jgi:hypothetical protein
MIVVEASAGVGGKILVHKDTTHASRVIGDAAANTEGVGVVAENEGQDERRKELTRR